MKTQEQKPTTTSSKVIQHFKVEGKETFYTIEFQRKTKKQ